LSREELLNWWLAKYHNTNVEEVLKKYPEECKLPSWFKLFPVTQEQHDDWYEWAIEYVAKKLKCSKKVAKYRFAFAYLNCAPYVDGGK